VPESGGELQPTQKRLPSRKPRSIRLRITVVLLTEFVAFEGRCEPDRGKVHDLLLSSRQLNDNGQASQYIFLKFDAQAGLVTQNYVTVNDLETARKRIQSGGEAVADINW